MRLLDHLNNNIMGLLTEKLMNSYSFATEEQIETMVNYLKARKGIAYMPNIDRSILLQADATRAMDKAFKDGVSPLAAAKIIMNQRD